MYEPPLWRTKSAPCSKKQSVSSKKEPNVMSKEAQLSVILEQLSVILDYGSSRIGSVLGSSAQTDNARCETVGVKRITRLFSQSEWILANQLDVWCDVMCVWKKISRSTGRALSLELCYPYTGFIQQIGTRTSWEGMYQERYTRLALCRSITSKRR